MVAFIKPRLGYDDALDAFGVHGMAGCSVHWLQDCSPAWLLIQPAERLVFRERKAVVYSIRSLRRDDTLYRCRYRGNIQGR